MLKDLKVIQQIAEARDKGDLSENAEYDAAKELQGHLEDRINKLESLYSNARVVDTSKLDISTVRLLTKVTIKNTSNNMEMSYSIVLSLSRSKIKKDFSFFTNRKRFIRKKCWRNC